jgi:argonaute-like protein implicated in RNA metabolism and viral defense
MFINALSSFLEKLASDDELNEWYLSTFIDENIYLLSTTEAFELSSHVIELLKDEAQPDYTYELLTILLALQRQTDSTQIPDILKNSPNFFDEFIKKNPEKYILNLAHDLAQNYRMKL